MATSVGGKSGSGAEIACGLFTALATAKSSPRCTKYDQDEDDNKIGNMLLAPAIGVTSVTLRH